MKNASKVFEYMTNGASLHNKDGEIIYVNPVFCKMFKTTNKITKGKKINDIYFHEKVKVFNNLNYINENIHNIHDKIINITTYDNSVWVRVNSTLIKNGENYFMVTYDDVSENYNLSYLYEHIFNKISTGVIFLSSNNGVDFIMKDMNPMACKVNQICDKSTIINKSLYEIGTPIVDGVDLHDIIRDLWITNKPIVIKNCRCDFNGIITWRNYDLIKVETGEIVIIFEDITEDVLQKEKLEQSDKYKSQFLSNMSHEIRSPINTIVGFSDLLHDIKNDNNKLKEYIDIIKNSSVSLMKIIDDVLDYSKIEAGKIIINKKNFSLNDTLEELYLINKPKVNDGVKLTLNTPQRGLKLENDEYRFRQIFNNLLSNAIKFTKNGEIEFGYTKKDENIEFYVRDTGQGITTKDQDKLFNRFSQSENNKGNLGHGLGLSISKELVTLMDGNMWLESEYNSGSTFYFTLVNSRKIGRNKNKKNTFDISTVDFTSKTILIVEDIEFNVKLLMSYLENTNAKIIVAIDGNDALIKYNEFKNEIDIILMDIQLPEMNGTEVTKIIRTIDSETIIIAQTAYAMRDEIDDIMSNGFNDLVKKPTRKDELLKMISKYI